MYLLDNISLEGVLLLQPKYKFSRNYDYSYELSLSFSGALLGGHVRAVFTLITVIFVICVSYTITSFKEMPLAVLELKGNDYQTFSHEHEETKEKIDLNEEAPTYGTMEDTKVRYS